jgi:hypothetical protein
LSLSTGTEHEFREAAGGFRFLAVKKVNDMFKPFHIYIQNTAAMFMTKGL